MRWDREDKLDLADIGRETNAATHAAKIASPLRKPKRLDRVRRAWHRRLRTNEEQDMPGNPREMIIMAERRFPVRIRLGVPPEGFGQRYSELTGWLDANCGADGWAVTPSGVRGVLNDAISIYFADATLANAFVARWCVGSKVETAGGVFQMREDEPRRRVGAGLHRTP